MNKDKIIDDFIDRVGRNYRAALGKLQQHGNDAPQHLSEDERFAVCIAAGCRWEMNHDDRKMTVANAVIVVNKGVYEVGQRV